MDPRVTAALGAALGTIAVVCGMLAALLSSPVSLRIVLIAAAALAVLGAGAMIGATVARLRASSGED